MDGWSWSWRVRVDLGPSSQANILCFSIRFFRQDFCPPSKLLSPYLLYWDYGFLFLDNIMGFCVRVEITNFVSPQDFQIFYLLFIEHLPLPLPLEDIVLSLPGQDIMSDNESLSLSTPRRSPRHLQHDKHQASSSPSADVSPSHPPSPSAPSTNNIIERVRSVGKTVIPFISLTIQISRRGSIYH